jgi:hypothetical protein
MQPKSIHNRHDRVYHDGLHPFDEGAHHIEHTYIHASLKTSSAECCEKTSCCYNVLSVLTAVKVKGGIRGVVMVNGVSKKKANGRWRYSQTRDERWRHNDTPYPQRNQCDSTQQAAE